MTDEVLAIFGEVYGETSSLCKGKDAIVGSYTGSI